MAKKNGQKPTASENYLSLGLGILVVVVIGALIFNYIGNRRSQPSEEAATTEEQATEEQGKPDEISLPATHKVAQGEDLWKISELYYKTGYNWVDIAQANNLVNPNLLPAGAELTIPKVEPKILAAATQVQTTLNEVKSPETGAITDESYTIAQGDNLWKIAVRAYGDGYKWVDIAKANNLGNPDLIYAGNVLKIPR